MLIYRELRNSAEEDDWVLDLGTKHGRHLDGVSGNIVALDLELTPDQGGIGYVLGDGYALPFSDDVFDFVVCNQVLEHVDRKGTFLDEIKRVIAPTGTLLISFPNRIYPGNPHNLPPFFSLLPRRIGLRLSRLLSQDQHRYYRDHVFNLSSLRGRNLLAKRFDFVEYTTSKYIESYPEVYEQSTSGRFLLALRPLIRAVTGTRAGARLFELFFGYSSYECREQKI